jgi:hypothetical protein
MCRDFPPNAAIINDRISSRIILDPIAEINEQSYLPCKDSDSVPTKSANVGD